MLTKMNLQMIPDDSTDNKNQQNGNNMQVIEYVSEQNRIIDVC